MGRGELGSVPRGRGDSESCYGWVPAGFSSSRTPSKVPDFQSQSGKQPRYPTPTSTRIPPTKEQGALKPGKAAVPRFGQSPPQQFHKAPTSILLPCPPREGATATAASMGGTSLPTGSPHGRQSHCNHTEQRRSLKSPLQREGISGGRSSQEHQGEFWGEWEMGKGCQGLRSEAEWSLFPPQRGERSTVSPQTGAVACFA